MHRTAHTKEFVRVWCGPHKYTSRAAQWSTGSSMPTSEQNALKATWQNLMKITPSMMQRNKTANKSEWEVCIYREIWMHMIIQREQQFWILAVCLAPLNIFLKNEVQIIQRISHFSTYIITTQHKVTLMTSTNLPFPTATTPSTLYEIACDW